MAIFLPLEACFEIMPRRETSWSLAALQATRPAGSQRRAAAIARRTDRDIQLGAHPPPRHTYVVRRYGIMSSVFRPWMILV